MKLALFILFLATATHGQGTLLWDESVNGPLSQFAASPTALGPLQTGTNTLFASVEFVPTGGGPGGTLYSDFFSLAVAGNHRVANVFISVSSPIAVWIGDTSYSSELGSAISPASGNLLSQAGLSAINSGQYGFYVSNQDFGPNHSVINYRLDFFVEPVPEPSTISLTLLGLSALAFRLRKSR